MLRNRILRIFFSRSQYAVNEGQVTGNRSRVTGETGNGTHVIHGKGCYDVIHSNR
jgi:hypothetical protein